MCAAGSLSYQDGISLPEQRVMADLAIVVAGGLLKAVRLDNSRELTSWKYLCVQVLKTGVFEDD